MHITSRILYDGTDLVSCAGMGRQTQFSPACAGKAGIRALAHGLFESLKDKGVHIATVTVAAFVNPGSNAAETVAEQFWQLHAQPKGSWSVEASYSE